MSVKERILAIRLMEKTRRDPAYTKRIGLSAEFKKQTSQKH